jgi:hypothetical protein
MSKEKTPKFERDFWNGVNVALSWFSLEGQGVQKEDVIQEIRIFYQECLNRGN